MLYLVINKDDQPKHMWSTDPQTDFVDYKVIGEAIKDKDGNPVDDALLSIFDGKVMIDDVKVEEQKKLAAEYEAKKEAKEKAASERRAKLEEALKKDTIDTDDMKALIAHVLGE